MAGEDSLCSDEQTHDGCVGGGFNCHLHRDLNAGLSKLEGLAMQKYGSDFA